MNDSFANDLQPKQGVEPIPELTRVSNQASCLKFQTEIDASSERRQQTGHGEVHLQVKNSQALGAKYLLLRVAKCQVLSVKYQVQFSNSQTPFARCQVLSGKF